MQKQEQLSPPILPALNFKTAFEELCSEHELLTCAIEKNRFHTKAYKR
jgi:hypothetical protein